MKKLKFRAEGTEHHFEKASLCDWREDEMRKYEEGTWEDLVKKYGKAEIDSEEEYALENERASYEEDYEGIVNARYYLFKSGKKSDDINYTGVFVIR